MGNERFIQNFFWRGELERKRSLGLPMRRWEDNIKMDLRKWNAVQVLD